MSTRELLIFLLGFVCSWQPAVAAVTVSEIVEVIDAVEQHHVQSPTRQEMVLAAVREIYAASPVPTFATLTPEVNAQLSHEISKLGTRDEITVFLRRALLDARPELEQPRIAEAIVRASRIPSRPATPLIRPEPAPRDPEVGEQMRENRYVGIGILFTQEKRPHVGVGYSVIQVMPRGPAYRAGMQVNDLIVSVDGLSMMGLKQDEFLKSMRGPEGSQVTVEVQQPNSDEVRSMTITRSVVPRVVVEGWSKKSPTTWDYLIAPDMGYVKLLEIGSSTVHDLKQVARDLREKSDVIGFDLVVDLRHVTNANLAHTVMVADAFRSRGVLGRVETRSGIRTFQADKDSLFPDSLIYVLVDGSVRGLTEWLASSLRQDNRVEVVGTRTAGHPYLATQVPLRKGREVLMATGILKVLDGPLSVTVDSKIGQDGIPLGVTTAFGHKEPALHVLP